MNHKKLLPFLFFSFLIYLSSSAIENVSSDKTNEFVEKITKIDPYEIQILANFILIYHTNTTADIQVRSECTDFLHRVHAINDVVFDYSVDLTPLNQLQTSLTTIAQVLQNRMQIHTLFNTCDTYIEEQGSDALIDIIDLIKEQGKIHVQKEIQAHHNELIELTDIQQTPKLAEPYRVLHVALQKLNMIKKEQPTGLQLLEIMQHTAQAYEKTTSASLIASNHLKKYALIIENSLSTYLSHLYTYTHKQLEKYPDYNYILFDRQTQQFPHKTDIKLPKIISRN